MMTSHDHYQWSQCRKDTMTQLDRGVVSENFISVTHSDSSVNRLPLTPLFGIHNHLSIDAMREIREKAHHQSRWWLREMSPRREVIFFLLRFRLWNTQPGNHHAHNLTFLFHISSSTLWNIFWYSDISMSLHHHVPRRVALYHIYAEYCTKNPHINQIRYNVETLKIQGSKQNIGYVAEIEFSISRLINIVYKSIIDQ